MTKDETKLTGGRFPGWALGCATFGFLFCTRQGPWPLRRWWEKILVEVFAHLAPIFDVLPILLHLQKFVCRNANWKTKTNIIEITLCNLFVCVT